MIDNVVIVSSGTVKGTQPCMHAYPFSPKFPSPPGCHITLSRVPCATVGPCWLFILNTTVTNTSFLRICSN